MIKSIKYMMLSVIYAICVIVFVWGFIVYRGYVGHFVTPKEKIELNMIADNSISVMTYNIKCDVENYGDENILSWKFRAPAMAKLLNEYKLSIICMQEVKRSQEYYMKLFLRGYTAVAVYRDNDIMLSECNPIFYRKDIFSMVKTETFWLSETPSVMSKGWDSVYYRICTLVVLQDKRTTKKFVVANTHLDNVKNAETKKKQAQVVLSRISEYNLPTLLTGDMNCSGNSLAIKEIEKTMVDLGDGTAEDASITWTNANPEYNGRGLKIDWIFQTQDSFEVHKYKVVKNKKDGILPSDHYPIYAEIMQKSVAGN